MTIIKSYLFGDQPSELCEWVPMSSPVDRLRFRCRLPPTDYARGSRVGSGAAVQEREGGWPALSPVHSSSEVDLIHPSVS